MAQRAAVLHATGLIASEDPEALLADEIADDSTCEECGQTGLLVLCDVCDAGWHGADCMKPDCPNECLDGSTYTPPVDFSVNFAKC